MRGKIHTLPLIDRGEDQDSYPQNAESHVWRFSLAPRFRDIVHSAVAQCRLDVEAVMGDLSESVTDADHIRRTLEVEETSYWLRNPKDRHLKRLAQRMTKKGPSAPIRPERFTLPEDYISSIRGRILKAQGLIGDLSSLIQLTTVQEQLAPFLREIQTLLEKGELGEIYDCVATKVGNEGLSFSANKAEILAVLMYLPDDLRYAVQDMLIVNLLLKEISDLKKEYEGEPGAIESLTDAETYLKFEQKHNHHWDLLAKEHGNRFQDGEVLLNEKIRAEKCLLRLVDRHQADPKALEAFKRIGQVMEELHEKLKSFYPSDLGYLAGTDYGHLLGTVGLFQKESNLRESPWSTQKNGRNIVILEDDSSQMEHWQLLVDKASPYKLKAAFADAHELTSRAEKADCYLLDIQNGEDREAGIRIATELLREAAMSGNRIKIIVFTNSDELYAVAGEKLKEVCNQDQLNIQLMIDGSSQTMKSGGQRLPIELQVCKKRDFSRYSLS